ncbi:hypothetical protein PJI17_32695, partial [Mycobacterium kansasii]
LTNLSLLLPGRPFYEQFSKTIHGLSCKNHRLLLMLEDPTAFAAAVGVSATDNVVVAAVVKDEDTHSYDALSHRIQSKYL